jgi:hypothetical protein
MQTSQSFVIPTQPIEVALQLKSHSIETEGVELQTQMGADAFQLLYRVLYPHYCCLFCGHSFPPVNPNQRHPNPYQDSSDKQHDD